LQKEPKFYNIKAVICQDSSVGRAHPWWDAIPAHSNGNVRVNPE